MMSSVPVFSPSSVLQMQTERYGSWSEKHMSAAVLNGSWSEIRCPPTDTNSIRKELHDIHKVELHSFSSTNPPLKKKTKMFYPNDSASEASHHDGE